MDNMKYQLNKTTFKYMQDDLKVWEKTTKEVRDMKVKDLVALGAKIQEYEDEQELQSRSVQDESSMAGVDNE